MNQNRVVTDRWSNPESRWLYEEHWPGEPDIYAQYQAGGQCGACSFYAKFNSDWGLCCNPRSRHVTETVFEHFTCPVLVNEGWEAHAHHW